MPKINRNLILLKDLYRYYKKNAKGEIFDLKTFKLVLDTHGQEFNNLLLEGKDVTLFCGLSLIGVRKHVQLTYISKYESKKQGRKVLKPNTHSGNYAAKVYWRRSRTKINTRGWSFRTSRELSSGINKVMQKHLGHTTFVGNMGVYDKNAKYEYNKKVLKIIL